MSIRLNVRNQDQKNVLPTTELPRTNKICWSAFGRSIRVKIVNDDFLGGLPWHEWNMFLYGNNMSNFIGRLDKRYQKEMSSKKCR